MSTLQEVIHRRPVFCRVCMAPTAPESSFNMFACKIPDAGCCLAELVALVGGIEVLPEELGLPEWCCYRCQLDVATAYRVRILCQESNRKLREALAKEAVVEVEEPTKELVAEQPFEPEDVKPDLIEIEGLVEESTGCEDMEENPVLQETLKDPDAVEGAERQNTDIVLAIYDKTWMEPTIESPGCDEVDESSIDVNEDAEPESNNQVLSEIFEEIPVTDHRRCCSCRTIFNNLEELLEHAKQDHAVEDPPKDTRTMKHCWICNKLISRNQYDRHKKARLSKTMFKCKTCGKLFISEKIVYVHHLREHYTTKNCCGTNCNAVFDSVEALQLHSKQVHLPKKGPPDPQRPVVCQICFKPFTTYSHLYVHRNWKGKLGKFKCSECQKGLSCLSALRRHELTHKVFRCKIKFRRHRLIHRAPAHQCKSCGKLHKTNRSLMGHMLKIHGIRGPYGCDLCPDASFVRQWDMARHKRLRHGIEVNLRNHKSAKAVESELVCKVEVEEPKLSRMEESEEDEDE